MNDENQEPKNSNSEKLISWILSGVGVGLVGVGIVGYFLQTPEVQTPEAPKAAASAAAAAEPPKDPKTPIILLTVDGLRADALARGSKNAPSLNAIAKISHKFQNAIAASNQVGASAASILSGAFPSTHQFYWQPWFKAPNGKKVDEAKAVSFSPAAQNVALNVPFLESYAWVQNWFIARSPSMTAGFGQVTRQSFQVDPAKSDTAVVRTPELVQNFLRTFDATRPERSFYWFHFDDLTFPYVVQPADIEKMLPEGVKLTKEQLASYKTQTSYFPPKGAKNEAVAKALYWAAVRNWDRNLATLIEGLRKRGIFDGASIVLVGTNGQPLGEGSDWTMGSILPSSVNVPLLFKLRNQTAGTTQTAFTSTVNVAPTLRELGGYQSPGTFQGKSLLPSIEKREATTVPAVAEMFAPTDRTFAIYAASGAAQCHEQLDPNTLKKKDSYCFFMDLKANPAGTRLIAWREMSKVQQTWIIENERLARVYLDSPKDPFGVVHQAR